MTGNVCVITGGSSGIGKATAQRLAGMGLTVAIVARDRHRGEAARAEIQAAGGNPVVHLLVADLSSPAEVRRLAGEVQSLYPSLNVLLNNAGVAPVKRQVTADGLEMCFAVNYLAPFLLTNLLLDTLKASAPARVVNVAGDFHRKATMRFDDLMCEADYSGVRANNQAKLALILFTYELARRVEGTGVTANCLHPGPVATDAPLKDPDLPATGRLMYRLVRIFFQRPEKGADTPVYLASSPEVAGVSGKYFINKRAVVSSPESYDEEIARRLWATSAQLTGLVE